MLKLTHHSRRFRLLLLALIVVVLQPIVLMSWQSISAQTQAFQTRLPRDWSNVSIGGGGYVTGLYLHPKERDLMYIRTDNGGIFRWNRQNQRWIPLIDQVSLNRINSYGGEAIALDPNNANLLYVALGKYVSEGAGMVLKSSDRGKTWVTSNLTVPMGGDQNKRWAGNRLAVNPFDSNVLLFGSRQNGLWRSIDGGLTWTQVQSLSATLNPEIGVLAIAFDPQTLGLVYISVYGDGIYQSRDAGNTWRKLPNGPTEAMKLAVARNTLYATSTTGVQHYDQGNWHDITPPGQQGKVFNGLSIHPRDPSQILVSQGEKGSPKIFYSNNGGDRWTTKQVHVKKTVPWLPDDFFADHASAIAFDPQVRDRVWLTDWFSVWRTDRITADRSIWTNEVQGLEQTVVFALAAPPNGTSLLSGIADMEGFYHRRLDAYPAKRLGLRGQAWKEQFFQDTYSIAYCARNPQSVVRVGGDRWRSAYNGAISKDGGKSWKPFATFDQTKMPQRVAVSATDPQRFLVTISQQLPLQTSDGGASWRTVSGLPKGISGPWNWTQPLASDSVNGNVFYYYADGTFFRSDNGGVSFVTVNTKLPKQAWNSVQTVPGVEGEVWVSLGDAGLYRSTDRGNSFSRLPTISDAKLIAFGRSRNKALSLYLYGKLRDRREGLFRSIDRGKTWESLDQKQSTIATQPTVLAVSQRDPNLVFVGTNGRGIYYRQLADRYSFALLP
jgi:photosystem II stability/assembly factor-like uncharacterized protein